MTPERLIKLTIVCLLASQCIACATVPSNSADVGPSVAESDPWEPFNRSVYAFNNQVDSIVLRPLAQTYDQITPRPAKRGVSNFFDNLTSPWITGQLLLQGRFRDGSEQFGRFFINTVYGVGGLFDMADRHQLPNHETDLGATLAKWGWQESRFVMLPLLGPSTLRDGLGQITEILVEPMDQELRKRTGPGVTALDVVQTRSGFLGMDETIAESYDAYAFIRDGWLQRRQYQLYGEETALPDYDDFLEEDDGSFSP